MKHYILLSVEVPEDSDFDRHPKWLHLSKRLEPLGKTTKGIVRLGAGVWLLPRDSGMTFASECMAVARASNLQARARFVSMDDEGDS